MNKPDAFSTVPASAAGPDAFLLERFRRFIDDGVRDQLFGDSRRRHYEVLYRKIQRFQQVFSMENLTVADCTADLLMQLRAFLSDESGYAVQFPALYGPAPHARLSPGPRRGNTVVSELKMLACFFSELEDRDEIAKSPFRRLGGERRRTVMRTHYDAPFSLYPDELARIQAFTPAEERLCGARDAFLLQCRLGCRVGDFSALTIDNVSVSPEGIPYVHYLPRKTAGRQTLREEVQTPLVRSAYETVLRTEFRFPCLRGYRSANGYNVLIRELLRAAGIDRKVAVFDAATQRCTYAPLWAAASSKLCRRTFVDRMAKVQVNLYASGLHREGSDAVAHYTRLDLRDRFSLMCVAFSEPEYRVPADR